MLMVLVTIAKAYIQTKTYESLLMFYGLGLAIHTRYVGYGDLPLVSKEHLTKDMLALLFL